MRSPPHGWPNVKHNKKPVLMGFFYFLIETTSLYQCGNKRMARIRVDFPASLPHAVDHGVESNLILKKYFKCKMI